MNRIIRVTCLALVLILILPSVFGCFKRGGAVDTQPDTSETQADTNETQQDTNDTQVEAPTIPVTINGVALTEYTIVYSRKSITGAEKAAKYLNQELKTLCGAELAVTANSKDRPEILLGLDGDDATIAAAYSENSAGIIGTTGKKIVLQGSTYTALCRLIDAFLAKATGDESGMSISVDACEAPNISKASLKVMSYNVLRDLSKPGRPADAREQMVATILENDIDVFGTQEDGSENHDAFISLLGGSYSSYKGVLDARDTGNYIYWKTEKFDLVKSGYFYLSNTPGTRTKYSDSTQYRTLSYVILKEKLTAKQFLFVDVHLDYRASEATRIKQITVLGDLIGKINNDGLPVIVLGDFNTLPTNNSGAISKFLSSNPEFVHTSKISEKKGDTGETLVSQDDFATRYLGAYDNIFVTVDNVYTEYFTVVDNFKEVEEVDELGEVKTVKKYPSDHLPVMAEVDIY